MTKEERKAQQRAYNEAHKEEMRIYRETHKDEKKAWRKAYYKNNKEKVKAQKRASYEAHKEELKAYQKAYYENNKEEVKLYQETYRKTNSDKIKIAQRDYNRINSDKRNARNAKGRAQKLRATPPWLSSRMEEEILEKYTESKALTESTGIPYHVDHIIPLQGNGVSGLHVPWNLQVITAEENLAKGNSSK